MLSSTSSPSAIDAFHVFDVESQLVSALLPPNVKVALLFPPLPRLVDELSDNWRLWWHVWIRAAEMCFFFSFFFGD